jgi:hypothetical protein
MPSRPSLRVLAGTVGLAAAVIVPVGATPASAARSANVSVDANRSLASIPFAAVGMNVAVYDGYMNDSLVPGLLKGAGIGARHGDDSETATGSSGPARNTPLHPFGSPILGCLE